MGVAEPAGMPTCSNDVAGRAIGPAYRGGAAAHPQEVAAIARGAEQPGGLLLSGLMRADGLMQQGGYGACQVASTFLASLLDTAQLQAEGIFDELCPSVEPPAVPADRSVVLPISY